MKRLIESKRHTPSVGSIFQPHVLNYRTVKRFDEVVMVGKNNPLIEIDYRDGDTTTLFFNINHLGTSIKKLVIEGIDIRIHPALRPKYQTTFINASLHRSNYTDVIIRGCTLTNFRKGMMIRGARSVLIEDCVFNYEDGEHSVKWREPGKRNTAETVGIDIKSATNRDIHGNASDNVEIRNCSFNGDMTNSNDLAADGLCIVHAQHSVITGNTIVNPGREGIQVFSWKEIDGITTITNNTIVQNKLLNGSYAIRCDTGGEINGNLINMVSGLSVFDGKPRPSAGIYCQRRHSFDHQVKNLAITNNTIHLFGGGTGIYGRNLYRPVVANNLIRALSVHSSIGLKPTEFVGCAGLIERNNEVIK